MNIVDAVRVHARRAPDRPALIDDDQELDWRTLAQRIDLAAGHLSRRSIGRGDIVALALRRSIDTIVIALAVARCGGAWLTVDWRMRAAERREVLVRTGIRLLVVDRPEAGDECFPSELATALSAPLPHDFALPAPSAGTAHSPAVVILSSGTTGLPKAVAVTHQALAWRGMIVAADDCLRADAPMLHALPLSASAAISSLAGQLLSGACGVFLPPIFSVDELIRHIEHHDIRHASVVPTMIRNLLQRVPGTGLLLPRISTLVSLGSTLHAEEKIAAMARITPRLFERYGAAGAGPICMATPTDLARHPGTVGHVSSMVQVEAVDEAGQPVPTGETGRIRVRGPGVASGFVGSVVSDDEQFAAGAFYPGDVGSISADGLVWLTGRAISMIIRGGMNIGPEEIERVLLTHPRVAEAAVTGHPDPILGEVPIALIVLRDTLAASDLEVFCRARLQTPKVPSAFLIVDSLPRTPSGKIERSALAPLARSIFPMRDPRMSA